MNLADEHLCRIQCWHGPFWTPEKKLSLHCPLWGPRSKRTWKSRAPIKSRLDTCTIPYFVTKPVMDSCLGTGLGLGLNLATNLPNYWGTGAHMECAAWPVMDLCSLGPRSFKSRGTQLRASAAYKPRYAKPTEPSAMYKQTHLRVKILFFRISRHHQLQARHISELHPNIQTTKTEHSRRLYYPKTYMQNYMKAGVWKCNHAPNTITQKK